MPVLSIIVPVYNKEEYLDSCILSILKQTYKDFELLLVNDGSSDSSGKKCDYYASIDKRVKVFHQVNKGVSAARNFGLVKSKGKFIGFVDSDDIIDKDMYEILIYNAERNDADISVCGMTTIISKNKKGGYYNSEVKFFNKTEGIASLLKGEFFWSANNKIYKSEVASNIFFEGSMHEDVLYTFRTVCASNKIVFQNISKYNYLVRDSSVSMSKFNLKYMETIRISKLILNCVEKEFVHCLNEAKAFDFIKNISLLNLLLLSEREQFIHEYDQVVNTLKHYSSFVKNSELVSKKHRLAFNLFMVSPTYYAWFLRTYCLISDSVVLRRAK